MGLFSFLGDVGRAIGIGGAKAAQAPDAAALEAELDRLGLPRSGVQVAASGGTVTLRGTAPDAETREKIVLALGNIQGVTQVDDQMATPASADPARTADNAAAALGDPAHAAGSAAAQVGGAAVGGATGAAAAAQGPGGSAFYTVQKGDTLSAISKAHYGDANKYNKIFEANRPMLEHPDKIYPGQVLRIPPQAA